jgi:hypothetical protein
MNKSKEEIDGIRQGDSRYKDLNPLIDPVMVKDGCRTLVAPHASSVCISEQLDRALLFL